MTTKVKCPTCSKNVIWSSDSIYRPFCSKRCQLIDLGQWANEENRLATETDITDQTSQDIDIEEIEAMLAEQQEDFFKS
ncbi:DNA gyrase inhibitor YacG [Agaribacter marinus]|uniref:DNA gyrase inhibitor YacG n=1 Tax=Agaribacter marinus TaxID=1431249 RepID=UPI0024E17EE5|nr:DNA gyrase inhibitor YacG [Agaribacter marinus]